MDVQKLINTVDRINSYSVMDCVYLYNKISTRLGLG